MKPIQRIIQKNLFRILTIKKIYDIIKKNGGGIIYDKKIF